MSENRKYYYLKLKSDFFDSEEIKILESMENGYKYSNLLLKLYLKALKHEGKLRLNEYVPYNEQMIAAITENDIETVQVALDLYKKMGLMEVLEDGTICMLDMQSYIGKSTTEADRKRIYRKKILDEKVKSVTGQMSHEAGDKFGTLEDKRPPEIEIDLDKELEIEKHRALVPTPYEKIQNLYNQICTSLPKAKSISDNRQKHLKARWKQFNYDLETFKKIFTKVNQSPFCTGENTHNWKADFDWLIKNDENMVKVLEGKYDQKKKERDTTEIYSRYNGS